MEWYEWLTICAIAVLAMGTFETGCKRISKSLDRLADHVLMRKP